MNATRSAVQVDSGGATVRAVWGSRLMNFCVFVMIAGSILKALHPARVAAYMGSMGYDGGALFLVAALEFLCAIAFLLQATRSFGLLLVSAYFGGAISAHLAHHSPVMGGPFLTFMSMHPFVGSVVPSVVLACAWIGVWLRHPEILQTQHLYARQGKPSRQQNPAAVLA